MIWIAGVDGCRGGWIAVLLPLEKGPRPRVRLCPDFDALLALEPAPTVLAVDMPIGLLDEPQPGGRLCDLAARKLLGRRASSVFSPPARCVLGATRFEQVRGRGLTIESFHLLPKIRQIDRSLGPELQRRVFEAHPELAFRDLAGRPLEHNKKTLEGREQRLAALERDPSGRFRRCRGQVQRELAKLRRKDVAPDDLLDAWGLARTALRIAEGRAVCLPAAPPLDSRGLRMEIWF